MSASYFKCRFWLESKSAQLKMTQFCQIVQPSLKLIGRKFGNRRRPGIGGFRPTLSLHAHYSRHHTRTLSWVLSLTWWSAWVKHKPHIPWLQCRHTGRRRRKTRRQLRFRLQSFEMLSKMLFRAPLWYSTARREGFLGLPSPGLLSQVFGNIITS